MLTNDKSRTHRQKGVLMARFAVFLMLKHSCLATLKRVILNIRCRMHPALDIVFLFLFFVHVVALDSPLSMKP